MLGTCGNCGEGVADMPTSSGCDFLVLGLEGCGKSLLLRRLACVHNREKLLAFTADTTATLGTEMCDIPLPRGYPFKQISVREVGGAMAPIWPNYFHDAAAGVVLVIDAGDASALAAAAVELYALLGEAQLQGRPFLMVLTKCDVPVTVSQAEVELVFSLSDLPEGRVRVVRASGLTGAGVAEMLQWMVDAKCKALGVPAPSANPLKKVQENLQVSSAMNSMASRSSFGLL